MQVLKLTTETGAIFYNALAVNCAWKDVEVVEMTPQEYQAIPATADAAKLFGGAAPAK